MDSLEVVQPKPGELDGFWHAHERDWKSELWDFRVVWHEQRHDIAVRQGDAVVGAVRLRIAASLAHIEALYVLPSHRKRGIGRTLLERAEAVANYYNCHKMTGEVFHEHAAETFFVRCGYHIEAVLPQHVFKLDTAIVRKFLL